ncbi:hypothetical protein Tco_0833168 [Tanacetum coccineum]
MAKRMELVTKQARLILPYGMLLTRLFDFIIGENPELQNESYVLYDRVMNPLAAQLERKPKRDRGTRRGRHSTSSSAFDQPSSSNLNDDEDRNNKGTSRASIPSPIRYGTDNPGTTMEECVRFESEKALKNGKVYNWETAKYGMVKWCLDDVDIEILRFFEPKFPAIIYNDALKLKTDLSFDPTFNHDIYLENVPSSPEYIYKDHESKAERKALRKRFSKKENFNVLNIFEDLFSCEIPFGGNLKSDKGIDDNKAGIKKFSENPPGKPCGMLSYDIVNQYVDDEYGVSIDHQYAVSDILN